MSTKNISRTVIEGGRTTRSKDERRQIAADRRNYERDLINDLSSDEDGDARADRRNFEPKWGEGRSFHDKLGPLKRWINSRVGRKWNDVFSEITSKFDTRTVPVRHIVYGHLLNYIDGVSEKERFSSYRGEFYIDDGGILRKNEDYGSWRRMNRSVVPYPVQRKATEEIRKWFDGRLIGKRGSKYFWFNPRMNVIVDCGWKDGGGGFFGHMLGGPDSHTCKFKWRKHFIVMVPRHVDRSKSGLNRSAMYSKPTPHPVPTELAEMWRHEESTGPYLQGKQLTSDELKKFEKLSSLVGKEVMKTLTMEFFEEKKDNLGRVYREPI